MKMGNNKIIYSGNLTVRYSMCDFIAAVREFPLLWNRTHPDFHIREKRDQAWQDVCGKVCSNFSEITKDEQDKIVETFIKRWKNTRDCYLRSLRLRDDSSNCVIRRYIYENELRFLASRKSKTTDKTESKSINKKRKTSSHEKSKRNLRSGLVAANSGGTKKVAENNTETDFDSELDNICMVVDDIVKELNDGPISESSTINTGIKQESALKCQSNISQTTRKEFTVDINRANETSGIETINSNQTVTEPTSNENRVFIENTAEVDADQSFFNSIKPMMRNLSADTKLDFQIEVLKLLKHFRNK